MVVACIYDVREFNMHFLENYRSIKTTFNSHMQLKNISPRNCPQIMSFCMLCCISKWQIKITVFIRQKRQIVPLKNLKNITLSHNDGAVICLWRLQSCRRANTYFLDMKPALGDQKYIFVFSSCMMRKLRSVVI